MKLIELLTENRAEFIAQKMGNKLQLAAKHEGKDLSVEDILSQLEQADPTPHKQFLQWIANQYVANQFRLEDYPRIKDELLQFQILARRNKLEQKDINRYSYYSLSDAIEKAIGTSGITKSNYDLADCKVLYNGPLGILAIPQTEAAAKELGKGTKWCTAADKNNMFEHYAYNGDLFVWIGSDGKKYQWWVRQVFYREGKFVSTIQQEDNYELYLQFMNDKDHPVDTNIIQQLASPIQKCLNAIRMSIFNKLWIQKELRNVWGFIEAWNTEISPNLRWTEIEETIKNNGSVAADYAVNVIKQRWEEAEPAIFSSISHNVPDYIKKFIGGRCSEYEQTLLQRNNPWDAMSYARIIDSRVPPLEPLIMSDARLILPYAKDMIKGRWIEAESRFFDDWYPSQAVKYAIEVRKSRWPELEQKLLDTMLESGPTMPAMSYLRLMNGRWPELEKIIIDNNLRLEWRRYIEALTFYKTVQPNDMPKWPK